MQIMYNTTVSSGLFPTKWDVDLGTPINSTPFYIDLCTIRKADYSVSEDYSVGAFGDSAYEYLLKQWLLTGKTEPKSRDLCNFPGIFHLHSRSQFSTL
jgi:mannosyl-oligosaccharide alpha-1,2-mannosidase